MSSSTLRLSNHNPRNVSNPSSSSSQSTYNLLSSSTSSRSPSSSSTPSSRRTYLLSHLQSNTHTHPRPPPSLSSSHERKVHAKKLLKKYPVISPESFGRVSKYCPVCLDLLTSATITKTACNHLVHRSCLLKRLTDDPATACPSCRIPVKAPRKARNVRSNGKLEKGSKPASLHLGAGAGMGAPLAGMGPIETLN